ncbi:MAG: tRNA pseudouridine(55) synthase TruB [Hydrogenoanaerobacterium sp.]
MNSGILLINKPSGFTSFDVIAKMRGMSRVRKIGHSGTLDPMATGVLPLLFESATKACDIMPNQNKRYKAQLCLGLTTDTQDITGKILTQCEFTVKKDDVLAVLPQFSGDIMQLPPMYSALQIDGRRLYDIAREGREVHRELRPVTIYNIALTEADDEKHLYTLDILCSKGTYIRTICNDIGQKLGCGAVLTALCRTEAAGFTLADCITLEQAQQAADEGSLFEHLLPVESAFKDLPRITLDAYRSKLFQNGVPLCLSHNKIPLISGSFTVYSDNNVFLGLAHNNLEKDELVMDKLFAVIKQGG